MYVNTIKYLMISVVCDVKICRCIQLYELQLDCWKAGYLQDRLQTLFTTHANTHVCTHMHKYTHISRVVLEITVGHWPFSDQFQHLANQNPFWSAKFPMHF